MSQLELCRECIDKELLDKVDYKFGDSLSQIFDCSSCDSCKKDKPSVVEFLFMMALQSGELKFWTKKEAI